ncbi:putative disease resistance RPP13-like protein 3 [Cinnamomum micranthum f. kanehirae]|uniref:Putative disease resistance RPP13-like protein 3 n=1 Tax=Cinnamomum micranthum f. kanehirae TaxID=337451 RepID=A0A443Q3Z7_9MAGN|nr:putative disease resistance RPP13-like protein 3 [Cinnamomum micranthum f. kanehirae]
MILSDYLKWENYLVVVDDIWSIEAWDTLGGIFQDGMSKRRVILTTSSKEVAGLLNHPHVTHGMRLLNDDEGWELFMKKIVPGGDPSTSCPSNLVEMGRKILEKCEEDYASNSAKLIRLWIAEGFIQQKDNKLMEDAAEDYLRGAHQQEHDSSSK